MHASEASDSSNNEYFGSASSQLNAGMRHVFLRRFRAQVSMRASELSLRGFRNAVNLRKSVVRV